MTEDRDPKLEAAYRALGAEEPPRALDDAILAAARRSAQPWTRRWAVPLSLAAVVVLSVTVTLRIQHEQPGIEMPVRVKEEVAKAEVPAKPAEEPAAQVPQLKAKTRKDAEAFPSSRRDQGVAEDRAPPAASAATPLAAPATAQAAPPTVLPAETSSLAKRADARSELGSAAGSVAAPPAPAATAPGMRAMQRERAAAELTAGSGRH